MEEEDEIHELACYLVQIVAGETKLPSPYSADAINTFWLASSLNVGKITSLPSTQDVTHKAHVNIAKKSEAENCK